MLSNDLSRLDFCNSKKPPISNSKVSIPNLQLPSRSPAEGVQPLTQKVGHKYETKTKKQPIMKDNIDTKRSLHINNVSVCLTEENPHVNLVNPVTLADKDWTDEYKLNKLMT